MISNQLWSILKSLPALVMVGANYGCAGSMPTYPSMGDDDAARIIANRLAMIQTLSAQCEIVMTNDRGDSVRLDGVLAAATPDRLRLRAWKFDQALFDLTLTSEGLWLFVAENATGSTNHKPLEISAAQISQAWLMLTGGFFAGNPSSTPGVKDRGAVIALQTKSDDATVHCLVDRRTLTPTTYSISDSAGMKLYSVDLTDYRMINDIAWPTRIGFHSADGDLSLRLENVELNGETPEGAFVPPRRAVKQP